MKVYGVVMASGVGSRFWPLSRNAKPKQLLNLSGKDAMVNEAIDRLSGVVSRENIYVVTNEIQAEEMKKTTRGKLPLNNVLIEPIARNTTSCIGYAALKIVKSVGDGIMVITPSDAYIRDGEEFSKILKKAVEIAEKTDKLITVGITPSYPATGYGYIKFGESDGAAKPVLKFVEKPEKELAEKYLASGSYLWNSGMFVWKASVILQKIKTYLPENYACFEKISEAMGRFDEKKRIEEIYSGMPSISIDYGVMEKCDDILVIPGEFGWNDVGSWDTFEAMREKDGFGNVICGNAVVKDVKNSTIFSGGRTVALIGVDNLVVVETKDAVLVCPKDRAQEVKDIVDKLKSDGREELL